jgi:hypothetical protein
MTDLSSMSPQQRDAFRKAAGRQIDPTNCEVVWCYADIMDVYGDENKMSADSSIGREYFARAPDGPCFVNFADLPEATRDALESRRVMFPNTADKV